MYTVCLIRKELLFAIFKEWVRPLTSYKFIMKNFFLRIV